MKFNKNPVRAVRKLVRDIQCLKKEMDQRKQPLPSTWDVNKNNILIMVSSSSKGGAQRVACQVANGLSEKYNVVLIFGSDARNCYPVSEKVMLRHLPHLYFDPSELLRIHLVKSLKRQMNIDVSISLLINMNQINLKSAQGERVIVSERNNPAIAYPEEFEKTKKIYAKADHVIFQTREVQSLYDPEIQAHSTILPNPVSVQAMALADPAKRIVNVARLEVNKNQEMLIRAFARFLPLHPGFTLSFYGEGRLKEKLLKIVTDLGIQDKVFFHGNVDNIHEQIADAACFVLSSNVEGMPNALLEAMMMGLPCISTNCTGSKEVIRDGWNGLLVGTGDVDGLFHAMNRMTDEPDLAKICRENAKKTAEKFRLENVIGQWEKLCDQEIKKRKV